MASDFLLKRFGGISYRNRVEPVRSEQCDQVRPGNATRRWKGLKVTEVNNGELVFKVIGSSASDLCQRRGQFIQIGVADQSGNSNHGRNLDLQGLPGLVFRHTVPDGGIVSGQRNKEPCSSLQLAETYDDASVN